MARTFNGDVANYFSSTLKYDLPTNCTICYWAKTSSTSAMSVMGRRGSGTGWAVFRPAASDVIRATYFGVADNESSTGAWPADGSWHGFVITKSGSTLTFYRDTNSSRGTASATPNADATYNLWVGTYNNNDTTGSMFNGALAEIALFSRVLSSAEITQYMALDPPTNYSTSLDHYWKLDETSGNSAATTGGVTLTQQGTVGNEAHPTAGGGSTSLPPPRAFGAANFINL